MFLCLDRHTNEAKGSIQSGNDPFTSFACETADDYDKAGYSRLFTTLGRYAGNLRRSNGEFK